MPRTGGKSSGGGGSRSSGGGGVVHVSGYYRSNGTYVSGYTRSSPSSGGSRASSVSSSSGSPARAVHVHGYTRSDGTYVAPHTRSPASRSSMSVASRSGATADPGVVHVSGYTRSDGTYVAPHTRSSPSRSSMSVASSKSRASADPGVVHVSGYTRSDGTYVAPYTRSTPLRDSTSASKASMSIVSKSSAKTTKVYVDNAYNRKLGRVGMPLGTRVVSKKSNNRKIQQELEQRTVEDLRRIVQAIIDQQNYSSDNYPEEMYALNVLEQDEVEEKWKAMDVDPSTDIARLSACHVPSKIIPRSELQLEQNKIGRGGFGVVYAGLWHGTPIAFKKLHYQHMSKRHQESFTTEVTILTALNHPNVVRMFGVVIETDNIGIVMEYCTNRSLFHAIFIKCCEFDEKKKIEIVTQVASAVKYLHNHDPKIAHCDIKSENILLDKDNNAKLTDFGLSTMKNTTQSSQSNIGISAPGKGTPRYSAPEVLRGEILKGKKLYPTDIYSLSIVAFEVLLEEEAYEGLSVRQLEANVGTGDLCPILPHTLPKQVVDLLQNSWHRDPSERPTATEFHARWSKISSLSCKCGKRLFNDCSVSVYVVVCAMLIVLLYFLSV